MRESPRPAQQQYRQPRLDVRRRHMLPFQVRLLPMYRNSHHDRRALNACDLSDPDCPGNLNEALLLEGLERKSDLTLSNPEHAKQLSSFFCFENGNEVV